MNQTDRNQTNADQTGTVASPCNDICIMDEYSGLCRGCYRTLDEIAKWSSFSNAEKQAVLEKIKERL